MSVVMLSLISGQLVAEDWPQFRGINASGLSPSTGLPTEFSYKNKVAWSATLGDGIACPVVASGRTFATAVDLEAHKFLIFGFDAATGRQLWKTELPSGKLPRITPPNSPASSTPAADSKRVVCYFSTIGLVAFDAVDGHELWRHPLKTPVYLMDWGAAASPIIYKDLVLYNQDDDLTPYLVAVELSTGRQRWKTARPDMLGGYAIPVMCEANGRTDVVVAGTGKLKGYDPNTGKELWTCNTLLRTIMTSPVVRDGVVYIAVQSYGDSARTLKFALLEWLDTNQDGKLSKAEIPPEFWDKFEQSDKNKDGFLSGDELDTAFQSSDNQVGGGNTIQAVKGGGLGDVTKTHVLWNETKLKAPSNMTSPLVIGDQLWVVKAGGLASCFDAASGKSLWELQRIRNLGDYYASPIAADGKIFMVGRNGSVVVLAEGPKLKILAKNDMGGEIIATPAIADGRMYFRTRDKLICIANPEKGSTQR
jgi:outer membrane protein assembly factor BamB